jgi:prevent-host-death family protein
MDISKDIEPITALKRAAAELIARAKERQSPIVITQNGKPAAVLQDVGAYERQRQALLLLKLTAQGERDYEAGRTQTSTQARARIRKRLAKHRE